MDRQGQRRISGNSGRNKLFASRVHATRGFGAGAMSGRSGEEAEVVGRMNEINK